MKLLKPESCPPLSGVGNTKRWTMIVEGRGIGFWTRVRLPPTPLEFRVSNPYEEIKIGAFKNMGCISLNTGFLDDESDDFPLSIDGVRKWVQNEFGIHISKSSVCAVRDKCGADKLEIGAGKVIPKLKTSKEKAVLEAFKVLGLLSNVEEQGD